jgi:hypothetical protein
MTRVELDKVQILKPTAGQVPALIHGAVERSSLTLGAHARKLVDAVIAGETRGAFVRVRLERGA